ncbi:DUF2306 domain-containing protein [Nonomuraea sediminis]|uniref:DUF2306 domain-containing protein n=1 Tax=Nonomuraea sediminis TaxID=2835864 RepID=UPI001BDD2B38|nr:hypothetical protein [Nonomuraea sediminis]
MDLLGLPIPSTGPLFLTALAIHITTGLTCVICGALAALSRKGSRRHRAAGRVYVWAMCAVFASLTTMAVIRWPYDIHLLVIGAVALAAALAGYLNRHRSRRVHGAGMGASYIALLTGFYVDNGPNLPGWDLLPTWAFWVLPSLIGIPILLRALQRTKVTS